MFQPIMFLCTHQGYKTESIFSIQQKPRPYTQSNQDAKLSKQRNEFFNHPGEIKVRYLTGNGSKNSYDDISENRQFYPEESTHPIQSTISPPATPTGIKQQQQQQHEVGPTSKPTLGSKTEPQHGFLNSFSILNVQGLKPLTVQSTVPYIKDILLLNNNIFTILTETWLREHVDAEINIEGYKIYRADRQRPKKRFGRASGGVAIYMKEDYAASFKPLLTYSNGVNELLMIYSETQHIVICGIYRQPDDSTNRNPSTSKEFKNMIDILKHKLDNFKGKLPDIFIAGDFNLPHVDWENDSLKPGISADEKLMKQLLLEFMSDINLLQLITTPTHKNGNTLDLILTNNLQLLHSYETIPTIKISDHFLLNVQTHLRSIEEVPLIPEPNLRNQFDKYNFYSNKIDWNEVNKKLETIDWEDLKDDVPNIQINRITQRIIDIVIDLIPLKSANSHHKKKIPRDRRILFRKRKKILKKFTKDLKKINKNLLDIEYKLNQSYKKEEQSNEVKAVNAIKENPKYFFSYTRKHSKVKTKVGPLLNKSKELITDKKTMANMLQKQYKSVFSSPLTTYEIHEKKCDNTLNDIVFDENDIIDAISTLSQNSAPGPDGFPAILLKKCKEQLAKPLKMFWRNCIDMEITVDLHKCNNITPIYKGGNQGDPANYRPVSLTSHLTKVFEKIVRRNITKHIDDNNLFNPSQHGFREGRSCLSQLLSHIDEILSLLEEGKDVDVIYIDFSKAFDKVDHTILLRKLKALGIDGKLLSWIESFLKNRKQVVVVDGASSEPVQMLSGVPQGSVLGPLLFIMMISDINENIEYSSLSSFADDTRIKKAIQSILDTFMLQRDLNRLYKWSEVNNMKLNEKKFEHLHYGKHQKSNSYFTENSKIIKEKKSVKDLGVMISNDTNYKVHINGVIKRATQLVGWILRTFKSRDEVVMLTLWRSLVIPHLDYCSQLWNPLEKGIIQSIEQIQRSFTRNINGLKNIDYWERLKTLKFYSLQRRRERYIIIYTWCILEGITPNIGGVGGENRGISWNTNPRQGRKCNIPLIKRSTYQSRIYNSFRMQGPKLFNCLPKAIRNLSNCNKDAFKRQLDKFLCTVPDEPLVSGYTGLRRAESNTVAVMKSIQKHWSQRDG